MEQKQEELDDNTWLDELYAYLLNQVTEQRASMKELVELDAFLQSDDYDSEALIDYFTPELLHSNFMQSNKCYEALVPYCSHTKLHQKTYDIGFNFNYWNYHKNYDMTKKLEQDEDWFNVDDHGGFSPQQLYVQKKYCDLKTELLASNMITIESFNKEIYQKAQKYIFTQLVKEMKAADVNHIYHYGIKPNAPLSIANLICIIVHEDFSVLCAKFTASFRRRYFNESLSAVKKRNRKYWNLSKTLKETINYFGSTAEDPDEIGPFYCGISCVLLVPQFNIRIYGPISLTTHIEVAMIYSGGNGMIFQLKRDRYCSDRLRVFNTSWISMYPEENTRLCFGGSHKMEIESIRIMEERVTNLQQFNRALYLFDCMLNGTNMNCKDVHILDEYGSMIVNLINNPNEFKHQYIADSFRAFALMKTQIVINLYCLHKWFESLKHLIVDSENIINPMILKLFCNVKKIMIYSTSRNGKDKYSVNVSKLIQIMNANSCNKDLVIVIKAKWPRKNYYAFSDDEESEDEEEESEDEEEEKSVHRSWIFDEFKSINSNDINVSLSLSITGRYYNEDCLIVSKQNNWSISRYSQIYKIVSELCVFGFVRRYCNTFSIFIPYEVTKQIVLFYDDEIAQHDDSNTKSIEECSLDEMIKILQEYGFDAAAKKENRYKEMDKKWALQKYKQDIVNYFKNQQLSGKTFKNKGKSTFVSDLSEILDGEDLKIPIAILYHVMKHCKPLQIL